MKAAEGQTVERGSLIHDTDGNFLVFPLFLALLLKCSTFFVVVLKALPLALQLVASAHFPGTLQTVLHGKLNNAM